MSKITLQLMEVFGAFKPSLREVTRISYIKTPHTTLAYQRQLADDLAAQYSMYDGDGQINVLDDAGDCINKLQLPPLMR